MREAFGGAFMIRLVLVFIVIYVSFMAVAVNYAKAFRVKNQVINMLEQRKYVSGEEVTDINDYLDTIPYKVTNITCTSKNEKPVQKQPNGVCIYEGKNCNITKGSGKCYYIVETYIAIDVPFFASNMTLPVRGETKTIQY